MDSTRERDIIQGAALLGGAVATATLTLALLLGALGETSAAWALGGFGIASLAFGAGPALLAWEPGTATRKGTVAP